MAPIEQSRAESSVTERNRHVRDARNYSILVSCRLLLLSFRLSHWHCCAHCRLHHRWKIWETENRKWTREDSNLGPFNYAHAVSNTQYSIFRLLIQKLAVLTLSECWLNLTISQNDDCCNINRGEGGDGARTLWCRPTSDQRVV